MRDLEPIFDPKSIAVIGASREPGKIGHVIVKNFLDGGFAGSVYPINPNVDELLGLKCYPTVMDVPSNIDSAVVAVHASLVPGVLKECGEKGITGVVVISGGFSEVGNVALEQELVKVANKYSLNVIGPNCLGVLNPAARNDSIFLPIYKMGRPKVGGISFISQSGAVGGCIIDLAARAGIGMGKFVSYGNAAVVDEVDLLGYLAEDEKTRVIVAYLEGVKRGREFLKTAKEITKHKPIIVLKAGRSKEGVKAAHSHTGSLAGSHEVYQAAFKQAHVIEANRLNELFDFSKMLDYPVCSGGRIAIITNGGGTGVLAVDAVEENGLELAKFSPATERELRKILPDYANAANPLDLVGDADAARYEKALDIVMKDPGVDVVVVIVLFQTVGIDSRVVNVIVKARETGRKPIAVISTGGEYTEFHRRIMDSYGIPTYGSPSDALASVAKFVEYCKK
ncbi:Acetate--CoA ligase [ADP-forming] I [Candidatus Burarchaeum australiense]|nr:Acetate--CoA ligase [ADP-forming] I [Candidatus Burarchaeum australiense]